MADNVTGIVLDIPPTVLQNIKNADKAIKDLEQTSKKAAQNIKRDFDTTMVSGVEAFIKKVQEAQTKLGGLKMPTIDASGLSSAIQALSQAMATIDRSATTGSNRLTRIANAMTALQTANPNPQLFQNIADGITKIGSTSQQTMQNVTQLAQVMVQLAKDIRTAQQAQNAQNANTATAAQYNKLYKEQAQLIRDIQTLQGKKSPTAQEIDLLDKMKKRYAEIAQQIDNLNQKNQTAASNLARAQGQMRTGLAANVSSPTGAINYVKQAQSLNQLQAAYKNLKAVMATVDPNTAAWQQMNAVLGQTRTRIDEIKKKMGEFKNQASQVGDVAGQLKRTLAATFSISAITGYMNKLIETRAQFELQQVALRAILQDKQKADEIFQQVQQMALQSPFSIMQLTTYTKQLAAYRVEADKLVGTTKMLADVSAGLGVDIQRLILAFGQVKAANYLRACLGRGTKVKMFDGTFKNVEDVVVGDVLMGDDEQPRHVSKLYRGRQQMYRISYDGGAFRCNEHHILTVYDALKMRVSDVFVLDYLKEPYRYHGVKRIDGKYKTFIMKVEPDNIDTYYGFSIDGNHRFIIEDNIVTHNTEVRQFTEAGLNIAGELANYFSELQGKMISVGDVMEMITKRMVRFEDVEEVFKRVTSAGGMFYDMQKKQSETLKGQLQRIKDAMSIMFNDIGKSNQGAISTMLTLIRSLINHWRILAPIIQTVGAAMALSLAVKGIKAYAAQLATVGRGISALILKWRGVESAAAAAAAAERGAMSATVIGLVVTLVGALAGALWGAYEESQKLNNELERIGEESLEELNGAIANFNRLADIVSDSTKTYTEHQDALDELKRTYGEMIPEYQLTSEHIRKLNGDYGELTEAIQRYYQNQEYQKKAEAILGSDEMTDLKDELQDALQKANERMAFNFIFPKEQIKTWADSIAEEIATGKIPRSLDAIQNKIQEVFGEDINIKVVDLSGVMDEAEDIAEAFGNIALATTGATNARDAYFKSLQQSTEGDTATMEKLSKEIEVVKNKYDEFKKIADTRAASGDTSSQGYAADMRMVEHFSQQLKRLQEQYDGIIAARAAYAAQQFKENVESEIGTLTDNIKTVWDLEQQMKTLEAQGRKNKEGTNELSDEYTKLQKNFTEAKAGADRLAKTYGVKLNWQTIDAKKTTYDLKVALEDVAAKAFPMVASKAIISMRQVYSSVLSAKVGIDSFIGSLTGILPQSWVNQLPKVGGLLEKAGGWFKGLFSGLKSVKEEAVTVSESIEGLYSKRAQANVKKFGADMSAIDRILQNGADTNREMAENLRASAKSWRETVESYRLSTNKDVWLKANKETQKSIALMEKNAKAAEALANELWNEPEKKSKTKKTRKNTDNKDIWTPRLNLMQKVNKEYEKLLKYYTKEEAMARIRTSYGDAVAEAFKGTQWADISKWGTFDAQATVDRLQKLAEVAGKDAKKKILEAAGTIEAEIDIKIEEKNIQEAKDKIQALFDNYELTKTLGNLGLNVDLTYLVGGKPVKLGELRNEFEKQLATLKVAGGEEKPVKEYEDALKKVTDLENKNAQERLKNYNKYLLESMSERVQIELKAQQEISKIRNDATLDDFSKEQAINSRRKKMQEDLTKYDFDQFKGSDVYLQTFKDLERASKTQLQYVIDRLKELSAVNKNLSPLQVKAIAEEIKKAEDALGDKAALSSMFSNLKESIKYAKERNALLDRQVYFENLIKTQQDKQGKEQKKLYELTQKRDVIQDKSSQAWADANDEVLKQQMALKVIDNVIKRYQYNLKDVNENISAGEEAWNDFRGALAKVGEYLTATLDGINSIAEGLDSMGLMSDSMRDGFESASEIIGGLSNMIEGLASIDIAKPFSVISEAGKTIGGLSSTIGGFFGIGDKKKERQIQRLQEKVEDLQKAYEKLQTAIEEAYSFDEYNAGYNQAMKNIEENRKAIQEQMALEEAKKKTDKDKLKEYADALENLKEKEKELRESRYEAMGSMGDKGILSEAENWVKIWLDAYKETGDGLDALKEHWDDFFENLVLKQAASAVVSARMKKYVDRINAAIDSGETGLSLSQTFAQIGEDLKSELGGWNEDLKAFFDAVGISAGAGDLLLSDLQKGIQNITEPQAAAIEAYLNSMRFAVFEQNNILTEMLSAIQAQYGSNDNSPMLREVRAIRSLVASIDERLSRVIVNRNSANASYMLKVG